MQSLIKILFNTTTDTLLRQNALGCLQKVSLRRGPQSTMIDAGVVDWILVQLNNHVKGTRATRVRAHPSL